MKRLIIITLSLLLFSCENPMIRPSHDPNELVENSEYPQYRIGYVFEVPDSNKTKLASWITETMRASSSHMSAGDYEDPEDLIEEINDIGKELFSIKMDALEVLESPTTYWRSIPANQLTSKELEILNDLKNGK